MAKELGARGITVNTVAPGAIETDFSGGGARDNADIISGACSDRAVGPDFVFGPGMRWRGLILKIEGSVVQA